MDIENQKQDQKKSSLKVKTSTFGVMTLIFVVLIIIDYSTKDSMMEKSIEYMESIVSNRASWKTVIFEILSALIDFDLILTLILLGYSIGRDQKKLLILG
jgi:uncharacterized membrane protein